MICFSFVYDHSFCRMRLSCKQYVHLQFKTRVAILASKDSQDKVSNDSQDLGNKDSQYKASHATTSAIQNKICPSVKQGFPR